MPLVLHPRVRKQVGRLAALTAAGMFAATGVATAAPGPVPAPIAGSPPAAGLTTAAAHTGCPSQPVSQTFASFGDTSNYFPLPGGNFEGASAAGWTLSNARLTAGGEPFAVGGSGDSQSLTITGTGRALSPIFCLDATMPDIRFFARQSAAGSGLKVALILKHGAHDDAGQHGDTVVDLADGSMPSWAPTGQLQLTDALSIAPGQQVQAQLEFEVKGQGAWQIDDVYVDPWSFG